MTGFGPFLKVEDNPSWRLASDCGLPCQCLEVSCAAVDDWLACLDSDSFDRLLMIGVAAKAEKMRIELVARNVVGPTPDVRGEVYGPARIDPTASGQLMGTLWKRPEFFEECEDWVPSADAGDYLCNYAYYQALGTLADKEVGFLHVPPFENMEESRQRDALARILSLLSGTEAP